MDLANSKFTALLENYYSMSVVYGQEHALAWLDEILLTAEGRDAVKELVVQSVNQALDLVTGGADIIDFEQAVSERKGKKNEELN